MSYTKHTWADGELVTAAKMNNIENGIEEASSGGGVLVVHVNENDTFDKTWQEVHDAFSAGVTVIAVNQSGLQNLIVGDEIGKRDYSVTIAQQDNWSGGRYNTQSADGYPARA
jgi:hypothetical protein